MIVVPARHKWSQIASILEAGQQALSVIDWSHMLGHPDRKPLKALLYDLNFDRLADTLTRAGLGADAWRFIERRGEQSQHAEVRGWVLDRLWAQVMVMERDDADVPASEGEQAA